MSFYIRNLSVLWTLAFVEGSEANLLWDKCLVLYPLKHKVPIIAVVFASKRDSDSRWLVGRFPKGKALRQPSEAVAYSPGGSKWVRTGIETE